jgi:carboxyl-terminal processing protease
MQVDRGRKVLLGMSGLLLGFVLLGGVLGKAVAVEGTYVFLKLFNEAVHLVRSNYVEPVDEAALMEGAYRGMLESLDPMSEYLTAEEYRRAARGERGGPADVGMALSKRRGYAVVVAAAEDSPAARAGLSTGDRILTIDRRSTLTMGVWEASRALEGKAGSPVHLSVIRGETTQREDLELIRKLPSRSGVTHRILEAKIGLLRMGELQSGDVERVRKALQSLRAQGADRLVLDLRSNATGGVDEAVRIAGLFAGEGKMGSLSGRQSGARDLIAPADAKVWSGPLVLLVNQGTCGAAEFLAAALADRLGSKLVGERTWGSGSVQELVPLPTGDGLRLSVGKYLSPEGKDWNGTGLTPDLTPDSAGSGDPVLEKGLEFLRHATPLREAA